jgi:hypothetical protein
MKKLLALVLVSGMLQLAAQEKPLSPAGSRYGYEYMEGQFANRRTD